MIVHAYMCCFKASLITQSTSLYTPHYFRAARKAKSTLSKCTQSTSSAIFHLQLQSCTPWCTQIITGDEPGGMCGGLPWGTVLPCSLLRCTPLDFGILVLPGWHMTCLSCLHNGRVAHSYEPIRLVHVDFRQLRNSMQNYCRYQSSIQLAPRMTSAKTHGFTW